MIRPVSLWTATSPQPGSRASYTSKYTAATEGPPEKIAPRPWTWYQWFVEK